MEIDTPPSTPNNTGGYDYHVINTLPDRLICKICHLPSRNPYLSVCCGHVFCKSCLDNLKVAPATSNICPVCRDEEFVTFPNKQLDREIKSLHIYCTNREKGCEWQGELNYINNHLGDSGDCQFEEVKCSNECGKMIQRQYLTSHVETECPRHKVNCQYCHDTGEHQFIGGQHKEECPKLPLPCPNKCEVWNIPREDIEAHRKECRLELIQCEYYAVGCEVKVARQELIKHNIEQMEGHLVMAKTKLDDVQRQLSDTKAQLAIALKQNTNLTAVLMNAQLGPNIAANSPTNVQLDCMVEMFKCGNQICPVTIKMSEYSIKKNNKIDWYSDYFYSHNKGYSVSLNVFAAGHSDGKDSHLSVFLYLMKGPHDDELTWPLRGEFEIKLLNQIGNSEHYSVILPYDDKTPDDHSSRVTEGNRSKRGWGHPQYISNKDLNKITSTCQILKDNSLFFQVIKL